MKKILFLLAGVVILLAFTNETNQKRSVTEYSQAANWIVLDTEIDKEFDVFFMHPTTYLDTVNGMNANLNNQEVNKSSQGTIDRQASAFNRTCNLFAPYYQQMSMECLELTELERKQYLKVAQNDMIAAFEYYVNHLNNERPYIIAGHSQGSNLIINYLTEHPNLSKTTKLVGVYAIGYTISQKNINQMNIPLATNAIQTPCIITWNTIGLNGNSPVINGSSLCVNPLTWDSRLIKQDKSKNIQARIKYDNGDYAYIQNFTSAQIDDKGALVVTTPDFIHSLNMSMGAGVFHSYDYDFFYGNIVKNVAIRCQAWLNKHPNYKDPNTEL